MLLMLLLDLLECPEMKFLPTREEVGLRSFTSRTGYPVDSLLVPTLTMCGQATCSR
jgi:hypothetical protein